MIVSMNSTYQRKYSTFNIYHRLHFQLMYNNIKKKITKITILTILKTVGIIRDLDENQNNEKKEFKYTEKRNVGFSHNVTW